jgi:hypothetical protein
MDWIFNYLSPSPPANPRSRGSDRTRGRADDRMDRMYYRTPSVRDQRFEGVLLIVEVGLEASFTEPDGVSEAAQRVDPSAAIL